MKGTAIPRHAKFATEYHAHVMQIHLNWWTKVSRFSDAPSFSSLAYLHYEKDYAINMGRKRATPTTAGSKASKSAENTTEWANLRLTAADAPIITEDANDVPSLCNRLAQVFLTGADFSVRYNPIRSNYSAFIISASSTDNPTRVGISAFGPDVPLTLAAVLYKFEMFQQNPENFTVGGGSLAFG